MSQSSSWKTNIFSNLLKWKYILPFGILYSVACLLGTYFFEYIGLAKEYAIYDKIQQKTCMDTPADSVYHPEVYRHIQQLSLIDIGSDLIDPITDQVDQQKLAAFFVKYQAALQESKLVFLDYKIPQEVDSSLQASLPFLKEQLLLPISIKKATSDSSSFHLTEAWKEDFFSVKIPPLATPFTKGYLYALFWQEEQVLRYYKYKFDDDRYFSIPYQMCVKTHGEAFAKQQVANLNNEMSELRFWLRNKTLYDPTNRIAHHYTVRRLLDSSPGARKTDEIFKDKMVVIGLFSAYETKYDVAIDKLPTPVDAQMPGALVFVNAYLNLVTNTHTQRFSVGSFFFLLALNFLAALFMAMVCLLKNDTDLQKLIKAFAILFANITLLVFIFSQIPYFLLHYLNLRIPLGISLILLAFIVVIHAGYRYFYEKSIPSLQKFNSFITRLRSNLVP